MSGSPEEEIVIGDSGTKVEIEFIPTDDDDSVEAGKTSVIVCGELGEYVSSDWMFIKSKTCHQFMVP